jgi:hypothetical protein
MILKCTSEAPLDVRPGRLFDRSFACQPIRRSMDEPVARGERQVTTRPAEPRACETSTRRAAEDRVG